MEKIQREGRGGRDGVSECLVLMLVEAWAFRTNVDSDDPGRKIVAKEARTEQAMVAYAQTKSCRRVFQAKYNNDNTFEGTFLLLSVPHRCPDICSPRLHWPMVLRQLHRC